MFFPHVSWRLARILKKSFAALAVCAAVLMTGCAETQHELVTNDTLLLDKANNFYSRERFNQATETYRKIINGYPDSKYRKVALIGLGDSLYKEKQFEEASLYYERFVELYPMDDLTPRALFYYGMSHMMLTSTPDRSQTKTEMSIKVFKECARRYPDSKVAQPALWYQKEMENMLTQSKMEIARFYHRTNKNAAVIDRMKEFIEENPNSPDTPEAMFLLGDSFMREQSYRNAAEVFTVLIGAHPQTEWAEKARTSAKRLTLTRAR